MITHDNYEEFFLLYVDNELSAADRLAVETFAAGHPDLGEELEALLQCRLEPENEISCPGRKSLERLEPLHVPAPGLSAHGPSGPSDVSWKNDPLADPAGQEAYLLSYIDGELDETGRKALEELVLHNPSLLRELELLRQTVNIPDPTLVFQNKEVLYQPQSVRRIFGIPPAFLRVAAAAVIFLAAGLLVFNRMGRTGGPAVTKQTSADVAGRNAASTDNTNRDSLNKSNANTVSADTDKKNERVAVTPATPGTSHSSEAGHDEQVARMEQKTQVKRHEQLVAPQREEITEPVSPDTKSADLTARTGSLPAHSGDPADRRPANPEPASVTGSTGQPPAVANINDPASRNIADNDPQPVKKELSSFATQALLKDAASSDEDGLVMELASSKKTRLRGIFRKVSRVFEKTARADDTENNRHDVLVGNLQIPLK